MFAWQKRIILISQKLKIQVKILVLKIVKLSRL